MKTEIKNKYSTADIYAQPVCEPIPKKGFVSHLKEGARTIFSNKEIQLDVNLSYIRIMESYLDKYGIDSVVPGEDFFVELWDRMMKDGNYCNKTYSVHTRKKVARAMRKIINEHFLPKGITKRRVLLEVEMARYRRFFSLTKQSQDAIKWFEDNGKVVKATSMYINNGTSDINIPDTSNMLIKVIHTITSRKLLPVTISQKIYAAMRVLDVVGKNGFEYLTPEDKDKFLEYCDNSKLKKKDDYKSDAATFFINIKGQDFIKNNPFATVSLKKTSNSVRQDFIGRENIDKLKDLSTVDYTDKISVRDRCIALLAYDLALRIRSFLMLSLLDFQKDPDGEWCVRLRPDVQKGTKPEDIMYFFFPETKEILEKYIAIRDKFHPKTNHLFVSSIGGGVLEDHQCRKQFSKLCEGLGIKTYYGNKATPHHLRHSFATLNVEPLGLALPIYEIMKRLHHTRLEVTEHHYIHNNPYLKKLKHDMYKKRAKKRTGTDVLDGVSLADLEHWLSDKIGVEPSIINIIRSKYRKSFIKPIDNATSTVIYLTEAEALERLKHLSISEYSLRKYGLKKGACEAEGKKDLCRYGKNFRYNEGFIDGLANNWVPAKDLISKFKISSSDFYRRLKKNGWRQAKIGKTCYVYKADCV
jgi:integrase